MIVGADLDRSVTGILNPQAASFTARIERNRPLFNEVFSGYHATLLGNGVMDGDQLGTIREGGFDLDVMDHLGNTLHHVIAGEQRRTERHQLRNGPAVSCPFQDFGRNIGHDFRIVELQSLALRRSATKAAVKISSLSFSRGSNSIGLPSPN